VIYLLLRLLPIFCFNSQMFHFFSSIAWSRLWLLMTSAVLLTACEKVIDVELKSTDPKLVIEATLEKNQLATVRVSKSVQYDETNTFPPITDAVIILTDDTGAIDTLRATTTAGTYTGRTITGQPGRRYTLRVARGGNIYTSTTTMPTPIVLDSLRIEELTFGGDKRLLVVPLFQDPRGVRNYYRCKQVRNKRPNPKIFLIDDEFTDGLRNQRTLFSPGGADTTDDDLLISGDSVYVELQSIDPTSYEYLRTLNQTLESDPLFSTTPANPMSNFSGGALGYFNVYSQTKLGTKVP
jgi:hypothetical protein